MGSIAHRLTKHLYVAAAGKKWRILFTNSILLDIEQHTGIDAMSVTLADLSANLLRVVLYCALRGAGAEISLKDAGAMLHPARIGIVREILYDAWRASFPDPEPVELDQDDADDDRQQPEPLTTLKAWAKARYDFNLSDDEWLQMTPRMLHAIALRRLENVRQSELMLGVLCAHTVNSSFHAPKDATQPRDYMLHRYPPQPLRPVYGEDLIRAFSDIPKLTQ